MLFAMKIYKYHGTGNDFVVISALGGRPDFLDGDMVKALCDRNFGIGADGVLVVESGTSAEYFMRVLNADGSEAEMCGNGIRCVARHLVERMGVESDVIPIQTLAGVKDCRIIRDEDGEFKMASVSLGAPILDTDLIPVAVGPDPVGIGASALGREFIGTAVSMGNPHFVVFEYLNPEDGEHFGRVLSTSPLFPKQTNVEFTGVTGEQKLKVTVYERGVGLTLACGTGAGATGVAAVLNGHARIGEPIAIELPGGTLLITVKEDLADVVLEGPAVRVFEGELDVDWFKAAMRR